MLQSSNLNASVLCSCPEKIKMYLKLDLTSINSTTEFKLILATNSQNSSPNYKLKYPIFLKIF